MERFERILNVAHGMIPVCMDFKHDSCSTLQRPMRQEIIACIDIQPKFILTHALSRELEFLLLNRMVWNVRYPVFFVSFCTIPE
jgi:hypothetical protein